MPPCPWFPALAAYCRQHPAADMGVHITLTYEWDLYRWGPLSSRNPATGLLDEEGYLPRRPGAIWHAASVGAVRRETEAQVDAVVAAGITCSRQVST